MLHIHGMKPDHAEVLSEFLIKTAVDLFKVNYELICQDLADGTADKWCYIDAIGLSTERLLYEGYLLRKGINPSEAVHIQDMCDSLSRCMISLDERAMQIDGELRDDETLDGYISDMLDLPSPEEVEAEKAEAYRTGGLNLLKKEDGLGS